MEEMQYIEPSAFHAEMLRLRTEEQMDFLESLTGIDWGEPAADNANGKSGLGVVYHLESSVTGKRKWFTLLPRTGSRLSCLP